MYDDIKEEFMRAAFRLRKMHFMLPDDSDMKMSEMIVLLRIAQNRDSNCNLMDDVRENLFVSKPAISHILNSLERKGRVVREIDKNDRRKIVIKITDEGKRIVDVMRRRSDNMTNELISRFGVEDAKRFVELVNRFADVCADITVESGEWKVES